MSQPIQNSPGRVPWSRDIPSGEETGPEDKSNRDLDSELPAPRNKKSVPPAQKRWKEEAS